MCMRSMKVAQRERTRRQAAVILAGLGPHTVCRDEGEVKLEGARLGVGGRAWQHARLVAAAPQKS